MATILNTGTYGPGGDVLHYPLYDSVIMAAATREHTLFNVPVGQQRNGVTLTQIDCNTISPTVPKGYKQTIIGIHLKYIVSAATINNAKYLAMMAMMSTTILEIEVAGKLRLLSVPLDWFEGAKLLLHVPTVAGDKVESHELSTYMGKFRLEEKIELEELVTWNMRLLHPGALPDAALNGDRLRVYVDNIQARKN